ncbi:type II toxin-antitoxin system RelE/ParE family toxin [Kitasatospora sp. NBC_01287]|uniref:type II toxin-antitoxin system RelE family toxin n=1 Tax=Kitasatospora sp. NBC_01287 TaxID=2903573 RepID=UPI002253E66D|nr:type II toxin-antitoxin system RelE/ParE family toxin [Kitasatospora sp. NBC_01287]MCX4748682.1 type II toxin-antitoxin system RelE/ParE family toxin [Kitasatospora sp. NBC_01287]
MKRLSGHQGLYRLRVGDHRVVYEVHGEVLVVLVVLVVQAGHRHRDAAVTR